MGIHRESSSAREIEMLYQQLLDSWNRRDAAAMAALFTEDGNTVGFDGSQMNGRVEIEYEIGQIFADHQTAAYVGKVREVRFLTPDVALLRSVAGLVPPGTSEINPAANSVQSLVATRQNGTWRVALYHNTPAPSLGRERDRDDDLLAASPCNLLRAAESTWRLERNSNFNADRRVQ